MTHHVVTGGTGFVGSHLLAALLRGDPADRVDALARDQAHRSAAARVEAALAALEQSPAIARDRLTVLESDLCEPLCGLTAQSMPAGSTDPLVFWHLAASLQWRRGQRDRVFATNVGGTQNALNLAAHLGADLFVYVSTAFTTGALDGDIPEVLHDPPGFSNVYEESKCAAEHCVDSFAGLRTVILRPSVIVGTSHDYQASGSYTGIYGYLSELRKFKEMLGDSAEKVRFTADRNAHLSLIPVDHVVADSLQIVASELASAGQGIDRGHGIYHVTGRSEATIGDVTDYMLEALELQDRLFIVNEEFDDPTTLERFFAKRVAFFSDYMRKEKRFMRSAPPDRTVTLDQVKRFVDAELAI